LTACRLRQRGGIDFSGGKAGTAFETREKLEALKREKSWNIHATRKLNENAEKSNENAGEHLCSIHSILLAT
jgi:hypothetical protein